MMIQPKGSRIAASGNIGRRYEECGEVDKERELWCGEGSLWADGKNMKQNCIWCFLHGGIGGAVAYRVVFPTFVWCLSREIFRLLVKTLRDRWERFISGMFPIPFVLQNVLDTEKEPTAARTDSKSVSLTHSFR